MKAKIVYMAESGKAGIVAVQIPIGPVISEVSGWMKLSEGAEKGVEFDLPKGTSVRTVADGNFTRLVLG